MLPYADALAGAHLGTQLGARCYAHRGGTSRLAARKPSTFDADRSVCVAWRDTPSLWRVEPSGDGVSSSENGQQHLARVGVCGEIGPPPTPFGILDRDKDGFLSSGETAPLRSSGVGKLHSRPHAVVAYGRIH